jgi:F-type H+-transporting ATPase subunit delta
MAVRLSRRKIAEYIATQVTKGGSMKELATSLAAFLIDTRRTTEIELIIRDIQFQLAECGVVLASVVSADALSDATRTAIIDMVTKQTTAKTVELNQFIDPTVLGGVRIDIPGRQLDATIFRRLSLLTTNNKK